MGSSESTDDRTGATVLMGCNICDDSGDKGAMADGMEIDCNPDWGDGGVTVFEGRLLY